MPIKLNTASGGGVILQGANTASDKTITIPADDGTMIYANSSGNVGIGTSSPAFKLEVVGTIASQGSSGNGTKIYNDSASGDSVIDTYQNRATRFYKAGIETARIDSNSNFQFNSGYGSVATAYGCRAWVNFNGTGTVAIRTSGNVSSITDNGVGNYTVNFTVAMPDANYSAVGGYGNDSGSTGAGWWVSRLPTYATGSCQVLTGRPDNGSYVDASTVSMAFFR